MLEDWTPRMGAGRATDVLAQPGIHGREPNVPSDNRIARACGSLDITRELTECRSRTGRGSVGDVRQKRDGVRLNDGNR